MGFSEILVILVLALLVLGPERLPKLAADIGRFVGRARAMARQLSSQLEHEVHLDELVREQNIAPTPPPAATTAPTPSEAVSATSMTAPINPLEAAVAQTTPATQAPSTVQTPLTAETPIAAPVTKKPAPKVAAVPAPLQHSFGLSPPPGPDSTPTPHDPA